MALPTIVVLLAACVGGVSAASALLTAHDSAADAARLIARGDPEGAARAHVAATAPAGTLLVERSGELVCAVVGVRPRVLGLPMPLSARSCALAAGGG